MGGPFVQARASCQTDSRALQGIERRDRIKGLWQLSLGLGGDRVTREGGVERTRDIMVANSRGILGNWPRRGGKREVAP